MIARARRPVLALLTVVAAAMTVLLPAGAALAHDDVLGPSAPAAGAVLDALPPEVRLSFTAELAPIDPLLVVGAADGTAVTDGAPVMADGALVQALVPGAGAGRYTVSWRVVAADGHPFSGTFAFTVGDGGVGPSPGAAPAASPVADTSGTSSPGPPTPVLLAGMAAGLVALFLLPALVWRRRSAAGRTAGPAASAPSASGEPR